MFRREFFIIGAFATAIFLGVAGVGWVTVRGLHETSRMLAVDTLPGLTDAGLAEERLNDNRRNMRDMLSPHSAAELGQMLLQVRTNSTDALWRDYANSIFEPEDRQNYQSMMLVRSNYLLGCERYLDLVSSGKMDEASAVFNGELARSFRGYNSAAKDLFDYNVRQGQARAERIQTSLRYAPLAVAVVTVMVFLFGLILGLRAALSGVGKRKAESRNLRPET